MPNSHSSMLPLVLKRVHSLSYATYKNGSEVPTRSGENHFRLTFPLPLLFQNPYSCCRSLFTPYITSSPNLWILSRKEGEENAARNHHSAGGAMREPDRDGVLEAALPRARYQQGRHPRGLRYSGPPLQLNRLVA